MTVISPFEGRLGCQGMLTAKCGISLPVLAISSSPHSRLLVVVEMEVKDDAEFAVRRPVLSLIHRGKQPSRPFRTGGQSWVFLLVTTFSSYI